MRREKARHWYSTLTTIVAVTFLVTAYCSCGGEQTTAPQQVPSLSSGSVLFVQDAELATVAVDDNGVGRLTLEGVDARMLYFGDRPSRRVGSMPVQDALDALFDWNSSLGPPNAALSWLDDGGERTAVVVLESGIYDAEAATVVYEVRPLSEDSQGSFGSKIIGLPNGSLGPASLFIDSVNQAGVLNNVRNVGGNGMVIDNVYWYVEKNGEDATSLSGKFHEVAPEAQAVAGEGEDDDGQEGHVDRMHRPLPRRYLVGHDSAYDSTVKSACQRSGIVREIPL